MVLIGVIALSVETHLLVSILVEGILVGWKVTKLGSLRLDFASPLTILV